MRISDWSSDVCSSDLGNVDGINGDDDILHGGGEDDVMYGGGGNDTLYGDAGNDTMYGGAGDDVFYVTEAGDVVYGGAGTDTVYATVGIDLANFDRSEEHTSELQSLMRNTYDVLCLKKNKQHKQNTR